MFTFEKKNFAFFYLKLNYSIQKQLSFYIFMYLVLTIYERFMILFKFFFLIVELFNII